MLIIYFKGFLFIEYPTFFYNEDHLCVIKNSLVVKEIWTPIKNTYVHFDGQR